MANYRKIRSRIKGVENTSKITQAMKMVAAAKLRRAQDSIIAARPYGQKLQEILQFFAGDTDLAVSPLLEEREVERACIIVVAADRGLCGPFNSNVLRAASYIVRNRYAKMNAEGKLDIICIGKRAVEFFTRQPGYNVISTYPGIFNDLNFAVAQKIINEVRDGFIGQRYDRVEVVYNEFRSVIKQEVSVEQLLPISRPKDKEKTRTTHINDFIFEPSREQLLNALLAKYLNTKMWAVLLESNAAEQGARMTAMDNATRNARDLAKSLKRSYNKARQAAITTEIMEIVSGANALKNG